VRLVVANSPEPAVLKLHVERVAARTIEAPPTALGMGGP
jgi:hypothetical protein